LDLKEYQLPSEPKYLLTKQCNKKEVNEKEDQGRKGTVETEEEE
jgi:hypothetical protein